jgi:GNAT superfamily N-acetyltransferase
MTHFTLRPAQLTDIEQVVPMLNCCSQKDIGADEYTPENVYTDWTNPGFSLEDDMRVAVTATGELVGVVGVDTKEPFVLRWLWANVRPDYEGRGIGSAMSVWAEARAHEKVPLADPDTRVVLRGWHYAANHEAKRLYESHGYSNIRHSFDMERTFDEGM